MIDLGRRIDLFGEDHRAQRRIALRARSMQGNVLEFLHVHVLDLLGGILHGQHVVVARLRIDPVAGRDHAVGRERGDDIVDYVLRRQADEAGPLAVDVELNAGVLQILGYIDVRDALEGPDFFGDLLRGSERGLLVIGTDLNVERRGQALVDHGIDQAAGLEIRSQLRHLRG